MSLNSSFNALQHSHRESHVETRENGEDQEKEFHREFRMRETILFASNRAKIGNSSGSDKLL